MIVLTVLWKVFLGILLLLGGLVILLFSTTSLSYGVRIDNGKGKTRVRLRIGWFSVQLTPKKPLSEKKKQKKERKKKKKAAARAAKKEKKRLSAFKKAEKERLRSSGKKQKHKKPQKPKDMKQILWGILKTLMDYDYPYLKLITVRNASIHYQVGGDSADAVARRYGRTAEVFGMVYPVAMRLLRIKKHSVIVMPDFAWRQSKLQYDITVTLRPITLIYGATVFYKGFRKNSKPSHKPGTGTTNDGQQEEVTWQTSIGSQK